MSAQKKPEIERVCSMTEAKNQFNALVNFVQAPGAAAIVEAHGKPKGAIISFEEFETLKRLKEQERRRQAAERIRKLRARIGQRNADLTEEEADELANRFVREVVQEMHDSGRLYQTDQAST
jgi:prevent-host-death family protein